MNILLGHTPDGEPFRVWTHEAETFLEIGTCLHQLDHIAPGLIEALQASLHRPVLGVAA